MPSLPPNKKRGLRDACNMIVMGGLEGVARALHKGDGFEDVSGLQELSRRCRGVADLIDARLKELE